MTENLRAPWLAYEVIMLENTPVALKIPACFEGENEVLVGQPDQLRKVAFTRMG